HRYRPGPPTRASLTRQRSAVSARPGAIRSVGQTCSTAVWAVPHRLGARTMPGGKTPPSFADGDCLAGTPALRPTRLIALFEARSLVRDNMQECRNHFPHDDF